MNFEIFVVKNKTKQLSFFAVIVWVA